jgi:integrase
MPRKKGHYGAGSIDKSGENSWRLRYRIDGKRYSKVVKGTRTEAAKELRRLLHAGDEGRHVPPDKMTVARWISEWLELKKRSIKARTYERYEEILTQHVVPVLGDVALQKVATADIDKLYGGLTFAPSTAKFLHVVLTACFASAAKKKLRSDNPVAGAEKPAGDEAQNKGLILDDEEAIPEEEVVLGTEEAILDEEQLGELVQGFQGHSLYPIVATAAFTGMRRNEMLALRWVDIDLDAGVISVSRNVEVTKEYGTRMVTPKSKRSLRKFQIDASLVDLLRKERDRALRLTAGIPDGADVDLSLIRLPKGALVFPAIGANLTAVRCPSGVTTSFIKRARKLGHADLSLHDLRASHETALLDRGVPVHVVAKRCGHDPAVLLRVYARRTRKADSSAANVIGTLMKGVL